ncbi:hypothetical protein TeGR_g7225 [Tetraparma gracilis]|uniref:Uncharacterized protein n=1 Tax=Tetraparma gracilis TaxID=2962635 RepID=A0ABQ6MQD1_9STRA|nr:hypothetical protein TeGR_g7225 [Tetraparma gracilis]
MYYTPGLAQTLQSIAADDDDLFQSECKDLLAKITPGAATPLLAPPPLASPAAPAPPAVAEDMSNVLQRLDDIQRDVRGQPGAELAKLRSENGDLQRKNAQLQARMEGFERLIGGSAPPPVIDMSCDGGASVTPTPGKRSALSLLAEEREAGGRALKKVKKEKADAEDALEDTQDLNRDLSLFQDQKMSEIDVLKARIRELEGAL